VQCFRDNKARANRFVRMAFFSHWSKYCLNLS
jgi:hypothetical protein